MVSEYKRHDESPVNIASVAGWEGLLAPDEVITASQNYACHHRKRASNLENK
jgi:hypothetical protein